MFESREGKIENIPFAGIEIETKPYGCYRMHQRPHIQRLNSLEKTCTFDEYRFKRHEFELAWLRHTIPIIAATANLALQVAASTFRKDQVKQFYQEM